jgi:glycosyltransferase involved in cell wall biosynthesis
MNILFFTPSLARTGSEIVIYNLICNADREKTRMAVAVGAEGELLNQLPADVPRLNYNTVSARPLDLRGRILRKLGATANQPKKTDEWLGNFTLAFPGYLWYLNTICQPQVLRQARKFGVTCVVHSHELEQMLIGLEEKDIQTLVEYPKLLIANSRATESVLAQLGRKDNVEVLYPPVDTKRIVSSCAGAAAVRAKLNIDQNTFVWVMAGTVDPNKNPIVFLKLAEEMRRRKLNVHFVWIGGGGSGYRIFVERRAQFLQLEETVSWAGPRAEDYYDYLNAADGFVLTSSLESFSIASIEAAYLGKPIVSFDCRGVKEIVKPGMGVVVNSRNPSDMVEAMVKVMNREVNFDPDVSRAQAESFDAIGQTRSWQEMMAAYFAPEQGF